MAWILGIDEAGYGPNLGPFVMSAVACRVPNHSRQADLWRLLLASVRRRLDADDGRLLIDDSKLVHGKCGLAGLERGVRNVFAHDGNPRLESLAALLDWACPEDAEELQREPWYRGTQTLPVHPSIGVSSSAAMPFAHACRQANIECWRVRAAIVCPPRFNALVDAAGTKGAVLAHALAHLLRWQRAALPDEDDVSIFIDKHGGRNRYAAMIQHALPDGVVLCEGESMERSVYRIHGLQREMRLTFQPRADAEHFCVALASMTSKYLRELLMLEFNRFWREHIADLRATAGYPGDAARFLNDIRPAMVKLGLGEEAIWRRK